MSDTEIRSPIAHRNLVVLEAANSDIANKVMTDPRLRRHVWCRFDSTHLIIEAEVVDLVVEALKTLGLQSIPAQRLGGQS